MKNYRTPRTQAECEFTTGYPIAHFTTRSRVSLDSWVILGIGVVTLVLALTGVFG